MFARIIVAIMFYEKHFAFLEAGLFGPTRRPGTGQASASSPGSHRIPCPIAGRRGLERGRITLSQQTTGNRKTESAASRRSSQPSTLSHGLIGLHLHPIHQIQVLQARFGWSGRWIKLNQSARFDFWMWEDDEQLIQTESLKATSCLWP